MPGESTTNEMAYLWQNPVLRGKPSPPRTKKRPARKPNVGIVATKKSEQNKALVDPWTALHAVTGAAMGFAGASGWQMLGLAVAYEAAEQVVERKELGSKLFKTSGPESPGNVAVDLAVYSLGWLLASKVR